MQENKISSSNKYTQMQSKYYEEAASTGDGVDVDNVVGSFQGHNQWKDYKYLFSRLKNVNFKDLKVLDFGCGPGRNIVKYKDIFKQIDGVDISKNNLINAQNYFKEFYRVLKPGGCIAIQMGCGSPSPSTVPYHDNYYDAPATNRSSDCEIKHPNQLKGDLDKIGYNKFSYLIGPVGPGDSHPFWIYFNAQKPIKEEYISKIHLQNGYN